MGNNKCFERKPVMSARGVGLLVTGGGKGVLFLVAWRSLEGRMVVSVKDVEDDGEGEPPRGGL